LGSKPGSFFYSTAIGERSTIALEDGSTLVLNTATRLRVDFTRSARNVTLLSGQALFEVASDARRPFTVQAGDRRITALGTAFDVRVEAGVVRVTLLEGRVAVEEPGRPANREELTPGQQLLAASRGAATVRHADVERVTSWRDGRLVFENEPLAGVVAEVNRYSNRKVVLSDPALGELRISGTFRIGSPVNFISALRDYFPIEASEAGAHGDLVLSRRAAAMR
jgi:transmembrane sensor